MRRSATIHPDCKATLYRETERAFLHCDRVRFTAPNREQHVANREMGTIEKIEASGDLQLRLHSGRAVEFNVKKNPHVDYGYAVTSHSSQGQTADLLLLHVDTEQAGEKLVNRRLAYVAVRVAATTRSSRPTTKLILVKL